MTRKGLSEIFADYIETVAALVVTSPTFVPTIYAIFTLKKGNANFITESIPDTTVHASFLTGTFKPIAEWLEKKRPADKYNLEMVMHCMLAEKLSTLQEGTSRSIIFAAQDSTGSTVFDFYTLVSGNTGPQFIRVEERPDQNLWQPITNPTLDGFHNPILEGTFQEYAMVVSIDKLLA